MTDGLGESAVFLELSVGAAWTPEVGGDHALIVDLETRRDLASELGREVDIAGGWMDTRALDWLAFRADGRVVIRDEGSSAVLGGAATAALLWVISRGGADPRECGITALGLGLRAGAFSQRGPGSWGAFRVGIGPRLELRPLRSAELCAPATRREERAPTP